MLTTIYIHNINMNKTTRVIPIHDINTWYYISLTRYKYTKIHFSLTAVFLSTLSTSPFWPHDSFLPNRFLLPISTFHVPESISVLKSIASSKMASKSTFHVVSIFYVHLVQVVVPEWPFCPCNPAYAAAFTPGPWPLRTTLPLTAPLL